MLIYYDPIHEIRGYMGVTTYLVGPVRGESRVIAETDEITADPDDLLLILKKLGEESWQTIFQSHYFLNYKNKHRKELSTAFFSNF